MMPSRASSALLVAGLAAATVGQDPLGPEPSGPSAAELAARQDRGELDVAAAIAALRVGGEAGRTVAAIVRHEWLEVPAALLDGVQGDHGAMALLLRELALAPRPSLAAWAGQQADRQDLPADLRCYAFAAALRPLAGRDADLLVDTAVDEDGGDGYRTAAWLLDQRSADRLIGRLHAALLQDGVDYTRLLPFFDRLSPRGYEQLIGLCAALPAELRAPLVRYFLQEDVPAFLDRVGAALDGEIPLEPIWLTRSATMLDRPARVDRLLAVLGDQDADVALQDAAFHALVAARIFAAPVLDRCDVSPDRFSDIRTVLDAGVADLPVDRLLDWLRAEVQIAQLTAAALRRRPVLEPALERTLRDLLGDVVVDTPTLDFAMTLVHKGSPATVAAIWPQLRESALFDQFVDAVVRRGEPWGHELLLGELARVDGAAATPELERRGDAVRLALVALGDRRQLGELVVRAMAEAPGFVRRCTHYATTLSPELALRLLRDAATLEDDDLAVELIGWAATASADPEVDRELRRIWDDRDAEFSERQLAALHGLASGRGRKVLVADLRLAVAPGAPLGDREEALCYELVATMPTPLAATDVELLAEMVLLLPLADPAAERARAERWSDGRVGFPLAAAIGNRLRGGDPEQVEPLFAAVAERARAHPEFAAFAPQRLLVIWRALVPDPAMQAAVARATAALVLAATNPERVGVGVAHLFASELAERRGELAAAADHAAAAVAALLRQPDTASLARLFVGDRDPGAGSDPWSALAARPFVVRARIAFAAGEPDAAARALRNAREFAGRDRGALTTIDELTKSNKQ
ncbi:MAG: hypothetical protein KDE27_24560 [Planctomycetes bacterium]|nr:hypothetical protein [Planctomycetota bacterium]